MPVASIIIPTKNRLHILRQTLEYLQKAIAGKDIEVIVVNDNGEVPDLWPFPSARLLQNPGSGVASARNSGVSAASSERLLLLDDDMLVFRENIDSILELTKDTPPYCINLNWVYPPAIEEKISATSFGRYLQHYGFTTLKGWNRGNTWNDSALFETEGITSQFLYISRPVFEQAGGYTASFPFAGFEDYDLAMKLRNQGIKFFIYPLSTCWHNELDRLNPESWLDRKMRGAQTRRHAVEAGHQQLELRYSFIKKIIYQLTASLKPVIFAVLKLIPNRKSLDFLYFRCINLLLGTVIYEGFRKS